MQYNLSMVGDVVGVAGERGDLLLMYFCGRAFKGYFSKSTYDSVTLKCY